MSEPTVYMVISSAPMVSSQACWALQGTAEADTDVMVRMLADRLVRAWIETREQRQ